LGRRVGCWRGVWASTRRRRRMARGEGGGRRGRKELSEM